MDRKVFYYKQLVDEFDLNGALDAVEAADRNLIQDLGLVGISNGLTLSPATIPNLTLKVGSGTTYDANGQRIRLANEATLSCSQDENGVNTAVQTVGHSRILSIFIGFKRLQQTAKLDGHSVTVYKDQPESYSLYVVAGTDATSPTPPPLDSSRILLGDVTLAYGQTAINTGDISLARRQWTFKTTSGTQVAVGTVREAVQLLADAIGALVGLSDDTGPDDGATRVGMDAITGGTYYNVSQGTVRTGLVSLHGSLNTEAGARVTAVNGVQSNLATHISNPTGAHAASAVTVTPVGLITASTVQAALNQMANDAGWKPIPMSTWGSGWDLGDPSHANRVEYRVDFQKRVWFRGVGYAANPVTASSTIITQLPAEARPPVGRLVQVVLSAGTVQITATGDVPDGQLSILTTVPSQLYFHGLVYYT